MRNCCKKIRNRQTKKKLLHLFSRDYSKNVAPLISLEDDPAAAKKLSEPKGDES